MSATSSVLDDRRERLRRANILINTIASCGRRFFRRGDEVSRFACDAVGRIYFVDKHTQNSIPTYVRSSPKWTRYFTECGTLQSLVLAIAQDYIVRNKKIHPSYLGSYADSWAYGDDIAKVREHAWTLGIWSAELRSAE